MQLISDKKALSERCEGVVAELKQVDQKYTKKIAQMQEQHDMVRSSHSSCLHLQTSAGFPFKQSELLLTFDLVPVAALTFRLLFAALV